MCLLSCVFKRILELTKTIAATQSSPANVDPLQSFGDIYQVWSLWCILLKIAVVSSLLQLSINFKSTSSLVFRVVAACWAAAALTELVSFSEYSLSCFAAVWAVIKDLAGPQQLHWEWHAIAKDCCYAFIVQQQRFPFWRQRWGREGYVWTEKHKVWYWKFQIIIILDHLCMDFLSNFWHHPLTLVCWVKNHGSPHWFWQCRDTTWRSSIKPS